MHTWLEYTVYFISLINTLTIHSCSLGSFYLICSFRIICGEMLKLHFVILSSDVTKCACANKIMSHGLSATQEKDHIANTHNTSQVGSLSLIFCNSVVTYGCHQLEHNLTEVGIPLQRTSQGQALRKNKKSCLKQKPYNSHL